MYPLSDRFNSHTSLYFVLKEGKKLPISAEDNLELSIDKSTLIKSKNSFDEIFEDVILL